MRHGIVRACCRVCGVVWCGNDGRGKRDGYSVIRGGVIIDRRAAVSVQRKTKLQVRPGANKISILKPDPV